MYVKKNKPIPVDESSFENSGKFEIRRNPEFHHRFYQVVLLLLNNLNRIHLLVFLFNFWNQAEKKEREKILKLILYDTSNILRV